MRNKTLLFVSLLVITSLLLAACAQPTPEVVGPLATVEEELPVEVAQPVNTPTETPQAVKTATPEPDLTSGFHAPDPETWISTFQWRDIDSLDPALNYELDGDMVIQNIYDTLVTYAGADPNTLVPKLATWEIMDEGKTYVFTIRQGVKFHGGQELTAQDVAYSFQRGLLQGGSRSPQWLFTEALFGTGIYDIAELVNPEVVDDPQALQAEDPERLLEVCQQVTGAIVADEAAGTVTFHLAQPWAPLLPTLVGSWGSIIDQDWAIEQGAWEGDCATWQDNYGATTENAPLRDVTNGTGPYMLDHWTSGTEGEAVLVANEDYWLTESLWQGGPFGPPSLKRVVIRFLDDWGSVYSMLQAGEADNARLPGSNSSQVDPLVGEVCTFVEWGVYDCQPSQNPDQPLRMYKGTPSTGRVDTFFNFDINEEGGNPYIGSGKLDGDGIPPDFFSDIHVRKAFNYCFDWDTLIAEAWGGEAIQNYGPILVGLIGYDQNAPHYTYDLKLCREEIESAWDGALVRNGFHMQFVFCIDCPGYQTTAQILQAGLAAIDPKYKIEVVGLPVSKYFAEMRAHRLPIYTHGWTEDIHDPHNWAQPFMVGGHASLQRLPQEMLNEFQPLVDAGVAGQTLEERAEIYREIQRLDYEYALAIRLVVRNFSQYVQRWTSDYSINPVLLQSFYLFKKE